MLRSLYSGISGMKANQTKMDVIGNNVSNVGTTAFKSSRVRFQDMLSQNMSTALSPGTNIGGTNGKQIGLGVSVAGIDTITTQGAMQPTSRNLDVAVDGEGYFMVSQGPADFADEDGVNINTDHTVKSRGKQSVMYTRDGSLTLDYDGNLLTSDGYRVLGYAVSNGLTDSETKKESIQAETSGGVKAGQLNLVDSNGIEKTPDNKIIVDKSAAVLTGSGDVTVPLDYSTTSKNLVVSVDGGPTKTITLNKNYTSVGQIVQAINDVVPGIATLSGNKIVLTSPTKGNGSSIEVKSATTATELNLTVGTQVGKVYAVDTTDAANEKVVQVDATSTLETTEPKVDAQILKPLRIPDKIIETVYSIATDSNGNQLASDGTVATSSTTDFKLDKSLKEVRVKSFSIDADGTIKGVLEDGRVSVLGQIAMTSFKNPAGLEKTGKNLYLASNNSGEPVVRSGLGEAESTNNEKGYGDIRQGMLEMSNVDLAEQFTDMIVTSRAFQASGKMITTGDEILQDIINLKR